MASLRKGLLCFHSCASRVGFNGAKSDRLWVSFHIEWCLALQHRTRTLRLKLSINDYRDEFSHSEWTQVPLARNCSRWSLYLAYLKR